MWLRYVDDTFVIKKENHKQNFLEHINSVDLVIKFTVQDNKEDCAIPALDTNVKTEPDGGLSITVYRKPTHTDQYLQWDSQHHLSAKYSVINTLTHRVKTVCNKPELLQKEMDHLRKALIHCKYPKWMIDRVKRRLSKPTNEGSNDVDTQGTPGTKPTTKEVKTKGHIVIPYTQGLYKNIKKICSKYDTQNHFKGNSTIKNLVSPKDRGPWKTKVGLSIEHLKEPSPIHNHSYNTGHTTTQDNFQIIGREDHGIARTIKESIHIRVNSPH